MVKLVLFAPIKLAKFVAWLPAAPMAEAVLVLPFKPMTFAKLVEAAPSVPI